MRLPWQTDTAELLGKVTSDIAVWREVAHTCRVDLFCGLFMGSGNDGLSVSLVAERQFRKVVGYRQIPLVLSAMANAVSKKPIAKGVAVA